MDYQIDGRTIRTTDDFYDAFSRLGCAPEWVGRNKDALWDTLTGLLNGPVSLHWIDADVSAQAMGSDFKELVALMREAEVDTASEPSQRFKLHLLGGVN